MKFNLSEFMELDMDGLLAVNGGSPCGGSGCPSYSYSTPAGGGGGQGSTSSSGYSSSSGGSGGGSCSSSSPSTSSDGKGGGGGKNSTSGNASSGGGTCSNSSSSKNNDPNTSLRTEETVNKDGTTTVHTYNGKELVHTTIKNTETGEVYHDQSIVNYGGNKNDNGTPSETATNTELGTNGNNSDGIVNSGNSDVSSGCNYASNGQGPSVTSSNPAGSDYSESSKGKSSDTPSEPVSGEPFRPGDGADTTSGKIDTGSTVTPEQNPAGDSSVSDTEQKSGLFGQITDGSYADKLTMQYYLNDHPWSDGELIDTFMAGTYTVTNEDKTETTYDCTFSKVGCKEAAVAKIASEVMGENVYMMDVQNKCDLDMDGNLSAYEIATGLNSMLDEKFNDKYDVAFQDIEHDISEDTLKTIASKESTYVLGWAQNCHGGHWVVLEGYAQDESGKITFSYDGSSVNDAAQNRTYVLGAEDENIKQNVYAISRIQTFSINAK